MDSVARYLISLMVGLAVAVVTIEMLALAALGLLGLRRRAGRTHSSGRGTQAGAPA